MDELTTAMLAQIFAAQARVTAMQTENAFRERCKAGMAFTYDDFKAEADALEHMAEALRQRAMH